MPALLLDDKKKQGTPPLKYPGGKSYIMQWIVSYFPDHIHFVTPYCGSIPEIFMYRKISSEVVNDIDGRLTNFYRVLQGEDTFERFARMCQATPFSSEEFRRAKDILESLDGLYVEPNVEAAWALFVVCRMSFQANQSTFAPLSRNRMRRGMNEQAAAWLSRVEDLDSVHKRLQGVVIYNMDALDLIAKEDGKNTFFFLDPPYRHKTRAATKLYKHEMDDVQHDFLMQVLEVVEGKFCLCGYDNDIYNAYAEKNGWVKVHKEFTKHSSKKKVKTKAVECLWMNYSIERK